MDEECLILGTFEKNNKVDDTINIFDEDNDTQGESKKIKNPFKRKKQKRNSSVEGEGEKKKKKKKKTVNLDENKELPPNSNINISKTYTIAESGYSISETEIHHLASGISMVNRGTNTEAQPNVRSDYAITCCCVNGHQSQAGFKSRSCMRATFPATNSLATSGSIQTGALDQCGASPKLLQSNTYVTSQTSNVNRHSNLPSTNTIPPYSFPSCMVIDVHEDTNYRSIQPHTGHTYQRISGESGTSNKNYNIEQNQGNFSQLSSNLASTSTRQATCDSTIQASQQSVIRYPYDKVTPWLNDNTADLPSHTPGKRTNTSPRQAKCDSTFRPSQHSETRNPYDKAVPWLNDNTAGLPSHTPQNGINGTIQNRNVSGFNYSLNPPRRSISINEQKVMIKTIFEYHTNLLVGEIDENVIKSMKNLIELKCNRPIAIVARHWCCILKPLIMSSLYGKDDQNIHANLFTTLVLEKYESIHAVNWQKLVPLWPFHNEASLRYIVEKASSDKRAPAGKKLYEKLRILIPYYKKKKTTPYKENQRDELFSYYVSIIQRRK